MIDKHYYSKLLLLGEHIVLKGAQALAIPLELYGGQFQYAKQGEAIQHPLKPFVEYVIDLKKKKTLLATIDVAKLQMEVEKGLYFASNIPVGYGLGSSGAFVAAIYDQFCEIDKKNSNYNVLKKELAQLESYFHGASSGTDPLICYLHQAILISPEASIQSVVIPTATHETGYTIFLLDTKIARKTSPFVQNFLVSCEEYNYLHRCLSELIPASNDAIAAFLQANWSVFFELIHEVSFFQFKYFSAMIPADFRKIWLDGLSTNSFKLKLCGAGGGGFILGITKNFTALKKHYTDYNFQTVYDY